MKDDFYVIGMPKTGPIEIMVRNDELWLDAKNLSPAERETMLDSGEEVAFDPKDKLTYVRASYYARIWPEFQVLASDSARKLKVKLPWPEN